MDKRLINSESYDLFRIKVKPRILKTKILIIIASTIMILIILIFLLTKTSAKTNNNETCQSKSCINAADNILNNIDVKIDPCKN